MPACKKPISGSDPMSARLTVPIDSPLSASELRARCRQGIFSGPTSGHAYGNVQANLMIVPQESAFDFLLFCQRNPKPCPLIEVLEAGVFSPQCAPGADICTDYRVTACTATGSWRKKPATYALFG